MKPRIYVGLMTDGRELFRIEESPTTETTPWYRAVIGPFRTVRGAEFCRDFGCNNPHVQCVADAERLAAASAKQRRELAGALEPLAAHPYRA